MKKIFLLALISIMLSVFVGCGVIVPNTAILKIKLDSDVSYEYKDVVVNDDESQKQNIKPGKEGTFTVTWYGDNAITPSFQLYYATPGSATRVSFNARTPQLRNFDNITWQLGGSDNGKITRN